MSRTFEDTPAVRESVPLLVGIAGPAGAGKSFSALRLATGMQEVTGGDIYVLDSESRRSLHYADKFKFRHIDFKAPFGSLDYLEAYRYCVSKGAKIIVTDSASHEHESEGGYLWTHEKEIERMAGDDYKKAERVKFAAWIKPARERRELINAILQMGANWIFAFRAKDKLKIRPGQEPELLGWMPIGGDEWWFEMTALAILYPNACGVPNWNPTLSGEKIVSKLPQQFLGLLNDGKPLNEEHGRKLAEWARGGSVKQPDKQPDAEPAPRPFDELVAAGDAMAAEGSAALESWWLNRLTKKERILMKAKISQLKSTAAAVKQPEPKQAALPV